VSKFSLGDHVAPTIDLSALTGEERELQGVALGDLGPSTLCEYAIFEEQVLVKLPAHLSWEELSCAYVPPCFLLVLTDIFGRD
jgi:NADPH:quinone reductase-like Zn-dependent oxidoreductase